MNRIGAGAGPGPGPGQALKAGVRGSEWYLSDINKKVNLQRTEGALITIKKWVEEREKGICVVIILEGDDWLCYNHSTLGTENHAQLLFCIYFY